jgi:hypothetical protein
MQQTISLDELRRRHDEAVRAAAEQQRQQAQTPPQPRT